MHADICMTLHTARVDVRGSGYYLIHIEHRIVECSIDVCQLSIYVERRF